MTRQIEELRGGYLVPDYCSVLPAAEETDDEGGDGDGGGEVITNVWFGPIGTVR